MVALLFLLRGEMFETGPFAAKLAHDGKALS